MPPSAQPGLFRSVPRPVPASQALSLDHRTPLLPPGYMTLLPKVSNKSTSLVKRVLPLDFPAYRLAGVRSERFKRTAGWVPCHDIRVRQGVGISNMGNIKVYVSSLAEGP